MDDSRTFVVVAGVSGNSVLSGKAPRGFVARLQTLASLCSLEATEDLFSEHDHRFMTHEALGGFIKK